MTLPPTIRALVLGLAAVCLAACEPSPPPPLLESMKGFNLIVINIDSLRADHLGCYGYERDTSPFIDRLASEGVVFEEAMSNSSYTRESVAVLMSGRLPTSGRSIGWGAAPVLAEPTLAETLRAAGYRTGFFSNSVMLANPMFTRGFDESAQLPDRWGLSQAGPKLSGRASEFVKAHADGPFLLYLHYLDPHGPYDPPAKNRRKFRRSAHPDPVHVYAGGRDRCQSLIEDGFGPGDDRFEDLVARYDGEILHTDQSIEMLFETLEETGLIDRTLVVVTADHGEEFLEHDFLEHAWTLYRESLHIPLIFWAPGALAPGRVPELVSTVDLYPTVLALLDIPAGSRTFDGSELFTLSDEGIRPRAKGGPVMAEMMIRERSLLRAVIDEEWKYIAAQRWLSPPERPEAIRAEKEVRELLAGQDRDPWGPVIREELYRVADDPGERTNVLERYPEQAQAKRSELDAYRDHCRRETSEHPAARQPARPLSPEQEARLRALGYL